MSRLFERLGAGETALGSDQGWADLGEHHRPSGLRFIQARHDVFLLDWKELDHIPSRGLGRRTHDLAAGAGESVVGRHGVPLRT